jgi:hypothetical protein
MLPSRNSDHFLCNVADIRVAGSYINTARRHVRAFVVELELG